MAFLLTDVIRDLLAPYVGATAAIVISYGILAFLVLNFVMAVGGLMSYVMRKVMARIQTRIGPNRVGPFGLLQFLADGVKMASKEDIRPAKADKWAYRLAPYFVLIPLMLAVTPIPFSDGVIVIDLPYGLLFLLAIAAFTPIGEIYAGWGSNNKYATYGAIRAASLDVSYEIPMILSAVSVLLLAGSLSTQSIVAAQQPLWFFFIQPVGAFIFFVCALAQAGVVPTDLAESESELIAGYFTEYGGMKFGMFQIKVFFGVVFIAMLTVILYFGGWSMPFFTPSGVGAYLPAFVFSPWVAPLMGFFVFMAKTAVFTLLVLLTWFTLPRLRPDQFLTIGWKVLFPLSLLNLVVTAGVVYYLGGI
ncbi:MAG TPA: NADH-quinone oxidoreductase subunit NuoH [Candidatus Thermoplasmatota archaeon]|nr:NADH-quinone oxidoreductase subunit NuoH [Candidatus Thermoplasmatota archaeon]